MGEIAVNPEIHLPGLGDAIRRCRERRRGAVILKDKREVRDANSAERGAEKPVPGAGRDD